MDIEASVPAVVPQQGHNRIQALLENAAYLGAQSAIGVTALLHLGMSVIDAAHDGVIRPETANSIAQHYTDGCTEAGGTPGSVNTLTSKLRQLIRLGPLDGPKLAKDALRVREGIEDRKSPFETLVAIARFRVKGGSADLADEEIAIVIAKQKREQATVQEHDGDIPEPSSYEIPWLDIFDSKQNDREALIAFRDEIEARLRQIDLMLSEMQEEQTEVDEAATAPPAAESVREDA